MSSPVNHVKFLSISFKILGADLIGPLTTTDDGNKYIMTVTDLFTKFVYAEPLKNKSADAVNGALRRTFYLYGPPLKLITDQGREFCNQVWNDKIYVHFYYNIFHLRSLQKN